MTHDPFMGALSFSPALAAPPRLDVLMLSGFLMAFAQVVFFISRRHSRDMSIGLLLTSVGLAVYSVMAGVWPLAMVQVALGISAGLRVTRRFRSLRRRRLVGARSAASSTSTPASDQRWLPESRMSRMFAPPGSIN